ncbi:tyrosine specific protein phosphatase, putative [Bodo saltans]|uniref:Tyrosine specific protein phosphatase, putative n=1 Tax=Bodo saltans TaxID=75058 RepID=A0A0S4IWT3_BODSA|nr:tyrosine specific protein phosphatase, putative [Bodo saltans]|eukprot:CUG05977.1 tyrosine specific protein phosphatase, putative [Bodo saltans]
MSEWQRRTAAALRDQLTLMGQRNLPSNRDGFDEEFDSLRALDQRVRSNHDEFYTASLGSNMSKNRYREILPNEGTRVQLDPINNRGDGDYINANYVDGRRLFGVPFVYIATQSPLRSCIFLLFAFSG